MSVATLVSITKKPRLSCTNDGCRNSYYAHANDNNFIKNHYFNTTEVTNQNTSSSDVSNNINLLSREYPTVDINSITSLLETTSNDVTKTSYLIQQLLKRKNIVMSDSPQLKKRKERNWAHMDDIVLPDSKKQNMNNSRISLLSSSDDSSGEDNIDLNDSVQSDVNENCMRQQPILSNYNDSIGYIDGQMSIQNKDQKKQQEDKLSKSCLSSTDSSKPFDQAQIIKILSHKVLSQNERMRRLHQQCVTLEKENQTLHNQLQACQEQLQHCRKVNTSLQYYISASNQTSTEQDCVYFGNKHANHDVF